MTIVFVHSCEFWPFDLESLKFGLYTNTEIFLEENILPERFQKHLKIWLEFGQSKLNLDKRFSFKMVKRLTSNR